MGDEATPALLSAEKDGTRSMLEGNEPGSANCIAMPLHSRAATAGRGSTGGRCGRVISDPRAPALSTAVGAAKKTPAPAGAPSGTVDALVAVRPLAPASSSGGHVVGWTAELHVRRLNGVTK
mmetsp:Transcript_22012/g.61595  ORF Transcript_22012/g.61595 Transcript_22012/m.61595 type:complete len:122 (-) Transcript_22012:284-649(-)